MATIEELLRAALLTMDAVTAIVGEGDAAKIRADHPEESDDPPYIVIEIDNEDHLNDLMGKGGRTQVGINLVCRGLTRKRSRVLSEAVRINGTDPGTGLAGYGGTVLLTVLDCWLEDEVLSDVPRGDGSKRRWYDVNMSFQATVAEVI